MEGESMPFFATGISCVIHPVSFVAYIYIVLVVKRKNNE